MNPTARGLAIVLAVIALMASSAHVALANHKVYFDEDSNRQWPGDPYARFENYVYWTWWQGPSAWWWVDPAAYPSLQSTAAAVIGNWQNAIPELPFAQRFLQAEADLYFKTGADCGSQVPACYRVTDWHWDAIQQANFVFKAETSLPPSTTRRPPRSKSKRPWPTSWATSTACTSDTLTIRLLSPAITLKGG